MIYRSNRSSTMACLKLKTARTGTGIKTEKRMKKLIHMLEVLHTIVSHAGFCSSSLPRIDENHQMIRYQYQHKSQTNYTNISASTILVTQSNKNHELIKQTYQLLLYQQKCTVMTDDAPCRGEKSQIHLMLFNNHQLSTKHLKKKNASD